MCLRARSSFSVWWCFHALHLRLTSFCWSTRGCSLLPSQRSFMCCWGFQVPLLDSRAEILLLHFQACCLSGWWCFHALPLRLTRSWKVFPHAAAFASKQTRLHVSLGVPSATAGHQKRNFLAVLSSTMSCSHSWVRACPHVSSSRW